MSLSLFDAMRLSPSLHTRGTGHVLHGPVLAVITLHLLVYAPASIEYR